MAADEGRGWDGRLLMRGSADGEAFAMRGTSHASAPATTPASQRGGGWPHQTRKSTLWYETPAKSEHLVFAQPICLVSLHTTVNKRGGGARNA